MHIMPEPCQLGCTVKSNAGASAIAAVAHNADIHKASFVLAFRQSILKNSLKAPETPAGN